MYNEANLQGNWKQLKGSIKEKWGKLTDDDLMQSEGKYETLLGKLVDRYGYKKEEAQEKLDEFLQKLSSKGGKMDSYMSDLADKAEDINETAHEWMHECQEYTRKNPLTTIGVAAAVGVIVGMLIARP